MLAQAYPQANALLEIQSDDFYCRDPWPAIATQYPSFRDQSGNLWFVDEAGLIFGSINGHTRCDSPKARPKASDVIAVMAWIEFCEFQKTKLANSRSVSSYSAKHAAEKFLKRYIPNGAAILAFASCGFSQHVITNSFGELNTTIGIARRSYDSRPMTWEVSR